MQLFFYDRISPYFSFSELTITKLEKPPGSDYNRFIYRRGIMPRISLLTIVLLLAMISSACAAYVAMAHFDINGDGEDEIVRTEGLGDKTSIKIYEKIDNSYFFKPVEEIQVPGNLVQVPEIDDLTGDGIRDLFFATGSDLGIIYYDTVEETYKRQYEINADLKAPYMGNSGMIQEEQIRARAESDILLKMQEEGNTDTLALENIPLKDDTALQTI